MIVLSELHSSLTILIIGMVTVFTILLVVIWVARLVIFTTNAVAEDDSALLKGSTRRAAVISEIPEDHLQVIFETIDKLSKGKARIIDIHKQS